MNTKAGEQTPDRHLGEGVSKTAETSKEMGLFGGFASPGGAADAASAGDALAGELLAAEDPPERGRGQPKKASRARKDHLRQYAAALGAEPGELLIATVLDGLEGHLADGKSLGSFLEERAIRMAKTLSIKRGEAAKLLQKLLADAMPYTHQKLPTAIEMEGGQIMFAMVMPDGSIQDGAAGGPGGLDLRPADERKPALINDNKQPKSDRQSRTASEESQ
jgi:hypothetical protein